MRDKMPLLGWYLLYFSFSAVFADDISEFEKEMLLSPPGIGHPSDETTVYSKISGKTLNKARDTHFEALQDNVISNFNPYLKLNKDGIKVYIYSHKNSVFGTFKATTHIDASVDSVLAVVLDTKYSPQWIDALKKSFIIKKLNFTEQYHYQIFFIPFPFKNRDFILHSKLTHNPVTNAITISMSSAPNYCRDKKSDECNEVNQSDLVRVIKSIGTFKMEPDAKGTKITWIQHTDPGGNLPAWLVNQLVHQTPYLSFKNLAQTVKEKHYKQAQLIYDNNGNAVELTMPAKPKTEELPKVAKDFGVFSTF
jgi:hypothetical protein